ncbi:MAG: hypothetical protein RLZZ385_1280 [Pseudomonadota bacterium]|jgi:ribosomal protein S6--L-glutamate ligase
MSWVSFDPLRTLGLPETTYIKTDELFARQALLRQASWVLFPDYWQLGALIYGYKCRIFPSLASYLIGHDKVEMTRAFSAVAPAHVPDTRIAANTPEQAGRLWSAMSTPFVAKHPRSARGQGVFLIESKADWQRYLGSTEVLYVQEYLPIDRDLRIVLVGDKVLAAYWRLQSPYSFHNNLSRGGEVDHAPVPEAALQLVRKVAGELEIDHAGFDVAMVGGHPYLLEFNRLFGNTGIPGGDAAVVAAIARYLETRSRPQTPRRPRAGGTLRYRRLKRAA